MAILIALSGLPGNPDPNPLRQKPHRFVPDQCDQARLPDSEKATVSLAVAARFRRPQKVPSLARRDRALNLFLRGKMEVTMSHWRKSHEPAPQHSYLADWVIAAIVVLALVLVTHGRVDLMQQPVA
jgi:hypothetical protein